MEIKAILLFRKIITYFVKETKCLYLCNSATPWPSHGEHVNGLWNTQNVDRDVPWWFNLYQSDKVGKADTFIYLLFFYFPACTTSPACSDTFWYSFYCCIVFLFFIFFYTSAPAKRSTNSADCYKFISLTSSTYGLSQFVLSVRATNALTHLNFWNGVRLWWIFGEGFIE